MLRRNVPLRIRRIGTAALHHGRNYADKTDIVRGRLSSRPLYRARPPVPGGSRQNYPLSKSPAPARIAKNNNTALSRPRGFMSSEKFVTSAGRPLSPGAVAVMLVLCLSWGFNQIAVKLALPDIPPMLQAMIRSSGALRALLLIARLRGVRIFVPDGTVAAGRLAGGCFVVA